MRCGGGVAAAVPGRRHVTVHKSSHVNNQRIVLRRPSDGPPPATLTVPATLDSLFHRKIQQAEDDRSYPRQTVTQVKIGAGASRASRVDDVPGPGKPPWTMDTAAILETDIESVDGMADILRDNDRPLSPQKRRQTPRPRR